MLRNILHDTDIQSLQKRDTLRETFLEVDFAPHGTFGDGRHLVVHAMAAGQLVDALGLDEG